MRTGQKERRTKETQISVKMNLDCHGKFFSHMPARCRKAKHMLPQKEKRREQCQQKGLQSSTVKQGKQT